MNIIPDTMDFAAYEAMTECKAKVRQASDYGDSLKAALRHKASGQREAEMFSTKLRGLLEFRSGEVTAWAGYNGHRKSTFTGQVALDLCAQRKKTLLISLEMQPTQTLTRMAKQCSASFSPSEAFIDRFNSWTDGRLWLFDHVGRITPEKCIAVCRYFAQELDGQHVFIDSMMMVCKSEEHLDEQKQFTTDLVRIAQETGLHLHLVAHCRKPASGEDKPPGKYDLRGSAAISDQCPNVVTIWSNKAKAAKLETDPTDTVAQAEPDALVSVEKQRNGEFEGKLKLWFHPMSMRFCDDRVSPVKPYTLLASVPDSELPESLRNGALEHF